MNTCETCGYWDKSCLSTGYGTCCNKKIIESAGSYHPEVLEDDLFMTTGKYHVCGKNFGCIHWKKF
jgi:hypothetical protein